MISKQSEDGIKKKRSCTPLTCYPSSPCSSFYCSILVSTTHLSQYSDKQGDLMSWGGRIGIRLSVSIFKSWQHHPGCQEGEYKHRSHWVNVIEGAKTSLRQAEYSPNAWPDGTLAVTVITGHSEWEHIIGTQIARIIAITVAITVIRAIIWQYLKFYFCLQSNMVTFLNNKTFEQGIYVIAFTLLVTISTHSYNS